MSMSNGFKLIDVAKIHSDDKYLELDRRYEMYKFFSIFAIILIVDAVVFPNMGEVAIAALAILEIIFLLTLAYCTRVEGLFEVMNNLVNRYDRHITDVKEL